MLLRSAPVTSQSLVEAGLRRGGSGMAVIDSRRSITFPELSKRTARLANVLLTLGCDRLRPVAALVGNRAEYVEVDVAATRAGIPRVGLSDRLSADEWAHIIEDSQAAVLVATDDLIEQLDDVPSCVRAVLVMGRTRSGEARWSGYDEAIAAASEILAAAEIDPNDPNYILYTSGTTGRPKGAWHSHAARAAASLNMLSFELCGRAGGVMTHLAPVTHGSGSKILPFLSIGATNLILDRFDLERFVEAITHHGATHTFMVPTMLQRLLDLDEEAGQIIGRLAHVSFGGAPIAPALYRSIHERFGPIFVQVYGSCEAPHPVSCLHLSSATALTDELIASAGYVSPAVEARIMDPDRQPLAAGELGELELRAPHLMSGYWNNPDATADVLSDEGWYRSGDLASVGQDGLITFHDRKRDVIISGGLNVYPSEVERVLLDHPDVRQAAVIGYPDDEWGESVLAYIVPQNGGVSAETLTAWTRGRIAAYKKPRRYVFRDELPMGSSHKILRQQLRDELWEGHERKIN